MKKGAAVLLAGLCMMTTALGEGTEVTYPYTEPAAETYTANKWTMTVQDNDIKIAESMLSYFPVGTSAEEIYGLYFNKPEERQESIPYGLPLADAEAFPLNENAATVLNALGWGDYCVLSAMNLGDYYVFDKLTTTRGMVNRGRTGFEELMERCLLPNDPQAMLYNCWPMLDGRLVFWEQRDRDRDAIDLYAQFICNADGSLYRARLGKCVRPKERGKAVTATITPRESAEKVVKYHLEYLWAGVEGGHWEHSVEHVIPGYRVDHKNVANPAWIVNLEMRNYLADGTLDYVHEAWVTVDYADGEIHF